MTLLSASETRRAIERTRSRVQGLPERDWYIAQVRSSIGLPSAGSVDESFVEGLARWQRDYPAARYATRPLRVDGTLGPRTEAHLGIVLPKMRRVVEILERYHRRGGILFDSWGNDFRDNDHDGQVDERDEHGPDGSHFGRVYDGFQIGPPSDPATARTAGWSGHAQVQGIPATTSRRGLPVTEDIPRSWSSAG